PCGADIAGVRPGTAHGGEFPQCSGNLQRASGYLYQSADQCGVSWAVRPADRRTVLCASGAAAGAEPSDMADCWRAASGGLTTERRHIGPMTKQQASVMRDPSRCQGDDLILVHSSDLHVDDDLGIGAYNGLVGLASVLATARSLAADIVLLAGD